MLLNLTDEQLVQKAVEIVPGGALALGTSQELATSYSLAALVRDAAVEKVGADAYCNSLFAIYLQERGLPVLTLSEAPPWELRPFTEWALTKACPKDTILAALMCVEEGK